MTEAPFVRRGESPPAAPDPAPAPPADPVAATLAARGSRYGDFAGLGKVVQDLKVVARGAPNWWRLTPMQREAVEMICLKLGRVLNEGADPDLADSWHDIAGYARLVERACPDGAS